MIPMNPYPRGIMKKLTEKDFSFICPMAWDEMPESANGRFCAGCRKEVFDLSNCTVGEVRELQRKHGTICGSIKVVRAAAVAASLTAAACQDGGTTRLSGAPLPPPSGQTRGPDLTLGEIAAIPDGAPKQESVILGKICVPQKAVGEAGE